MTNTNKLIEKTLKKIVDRVGESYGLNDGKGGMIVRKFIPQNMVVAISEEMNKALSEVSQEQATTFDTKLQRLEDSVNNMHAYKDNKIKRVGSGFKGKWLVSQEEVLALIEQIRKENHGI